MKKKSKYDFWREALRATSLGWELALPIFGGVLIGYYLDRWLGTGHVLTLGLLFLGVVAGFYNVLRFARKINRDK
jgi:ATP synthase protein I